MVVSTVCVLFLDTVGMSRVHIALLATMINVWHDLNFKVAIAPNFLVVHNRFTTRLRCGSTLLVSQTLIILEVMVIHDTVLIVTSQVL